MIGRKVQDSRYGYLGVVTEVICTPANDVWTIDEGPFGELLIPVIDEVIDSIPDDGPIHTSIMDGIVTESEREDA
ncbi:ribosome maturation factor RimM [Collinsella sp. CAG:289]|nr:ribosome maturation factor RimM [Collinsella sp. CAG:289]